MESNILEANSSFESCLSFLRNLQNEFQVAKDFLDEESYTELRSYYQYLNSEPNKREWNLYTWAHRLSFVAEYIRQTNKALRILDAGCGCGTESILFSILGAEVVGVDLKTDRIRIAKQRIKYYNQFYDIDGKIKFINENIFNLSLDYPLDIIWLSDAISHIEPVNGFLELAYSLLGKDGRLIIYDLNGSNPYIWLRLILKRGFSRYATVEYAETGEEVHYAIERVPSNSTLRREIKKAGFVIEKNHIFKFFPAALAHKVSIPLSQRLEQAFKRIPVLSKCGVCCITIGRK